MMELVELLREDELARKLLSNAARTEVEMKLADFCLHVTGNKVTYRAVAAAIERSSSRAQQIERKIVRRLRYLARKLEKGPVVSEAIGDDTPVDSLEISVRSYNGLKNLGIDTVGELRNTTRVQLLKCHNLGMKSVRELEGVIGQELQQGEVEGKVVRVPTPENIKRLREMLAAERAARFWSQKLRTAKARWNAARTPELLASEEYKTFCKRAGISEAYNFGDVLQETPKA